MLLPSASERNSPFSALVTATNISRRSSSMPSKLSVRLEGNTPSSSAHMKTYGNSSPFAVCTVISFTASGLEAASRLVSSATWAMKSSIALSSPQPVSYSYTACFSSARLSSLSCAPSVLSAASYPLSLSIALNASDAGIFLYIAAKCSISFINRFACVPAKSGSSAFLSSAS